MTENGSATDDEPAASTSDDPAATDPQRPEVVWLGLPDPSDPARLEIRILGSAHGPHLLDAVSTGPRTRRGD